MQPSFAAERATLEREGHRQPVDASHVQWLYEQEYPSVVRHLTYLTGDRYLAEDLAQEAFGKLLDRGPTTDLTNPRAWLMRVASNLAYNSFRAESRRAEREAKSSVQPGSDPAEQVAIRDALDRLAPRDRAILMLRHAGFSYSEIAEVVEVKTSSVGTTLARAQRRFREVYGSPAATAADQRPGSHPAASPLSGE